MDVGVNFIEEQDNLPLSFHRVFEGDLSGSHKLKDVFLGNSLVEVENSEVVVEDISEIIYYGGLANTSLAHDYDRLTHTQSQVDECQLDKVVSCELDSRNVNVP